MVETITYKYTTEAELVRLMSQASLTEFLTDPDGTVLVDTPVPTTPTKSEVLNDAIDRATDKVNDYCYQLYELRLLANSRWVRVRATAIAAHYLTQRKGEPGRYQQLYDEAIADLQSVKETKTYIRELPLITDMRPTANNQVIDDRFASSRARSSQRTSSDQPGYSNQKPDVSNYGGGYYDT
jgi:phage gp36-like protein